MNAPDLDDNDFEAPTKPASRRSGIPLFVWIILGSVALLGLSIVAGSALILAGRSRAQHQREAAEARAQTDQRFQQPMLVEPNREPPRDGLERLSLPTKPKLKLEIGTETEGVISELPKAIAPPYTDREAAEFAQRARVLMDEVTDGHRKAPADLNAALAELKIDPKKLRGSAPRVGNATEWVEYKLSPNYKLVAAYTQQASKETAFRGIEIVEIKPVIER